MIENVLGSLASGLPRLVAHFLAAAAIYAAGMAAYLLAASITLAGAIVGLAIPISMTLATSVNVADILVWGAASAVLQAAAFGAANLLLRGLSAAVERGDVAAACVAAATQLAVGIVNAGAMAG